MGLKELTLLTLCLVLKFNNTRNKFQVHNVSIAILKISIPPWLKGYARFSIMVRQSKLEGWVVLDENTKWYH